jgi:hypothetical protein
LERKRKKKKRKQNFSQQRNTNSDKIPTAQPSLIEQILICKNVLELMERAEMMQFYRR